MCTADARWVHVRTPATLAQRYFRQMSIRNLGAVGLVILVGLVIGVLGIVASSLYTVGVLILFIGGVGVAVVVGEYLIRYFSSPRPPG